MSAVPTVSVLLTTYNREKYVAAAIESVLSQTFGDFELLIADDHSTDTTVPTPNWACLTRMPVRSPWVD